MAELYEKSPSQQYPHIGIIGPHGSGKTTLARYVSERKGIPFIESPARRWGAEFGHSEGATDLGQAMISIAVFNNMVNFTGAIYDRTPFDVYAYTSLAEGIHHGVEKELATFAVNTITMLDYVFFLPAYHLLHDDGHRSTNAEYQQSVEQRMEGLLNAHRIPYISIPAGSIEQRGEFLISKVSWYNDLLKIIGEDHGTKAF